jgi:pyruvate/2-oxoglutarate dehydrogenase complex dihydrolipoamide acyltransferase (E2) component
VTERQAEALEKLNQGIRESKQMVQQQTMKLAQDYFDDSVEALRGQIRENRATLEDLPDQVPGGREEAFQALFQELMDNYGAIEEALDEAQNNVANLDTEQIRRQGEVDATDAARRHARELGIDLTEIEGTGSDGRITVDDVKKLAETMGEEPNASEAAKRRAEELGIDLSQVEGTGSGGLITVKDVTSLAGDGQGQAAEQAAQGAQDTAGQVAGQAQGAVGQVTGQAGQAAQGVQDTAGQAAQQAQDTAGQAATQAQGAAQQAAGGAEEPKVTNAAKRKAEELGVDLSQLQGTGAGGLITIKDVVKS